MDMSLSYHPVRGTPRRGSPLVAAAVVAALAVTAVLAPVTWGWTPSRVDGADIPRCIDLARNATALALVGAVDRSQAGAEPVNRVAFAEACRFGAARP